MHVCVCVHPVCARVLAWTCERVCACVCSQGESLYFSRTLFDKGATIDNLRVLSIEEMLLPLLAPDRATRMDKSGSESFHLRDARELTEIVSGSNPVVDVIKVLTAITYGRKHLMVVKAML